MLHHWNDITKVRDEIHRKYKKVFSVFLIHFDSYNSFIYLKKEATHPKHFNKTPNPSYCVSKLANATKVNKVVVIV